MRYEEIKDTSTWGKTMFCVEEYNELTNNLEIED